MAGVKRLEQRERRARARARLRRAHDKAAPGTRGMSPDPSDVSHLDGLLGQLAAVVEREASRVGGQYHAAPLPPALVACMSEILGSLGERWQDLCRNHQAWADNLVEEQGRQGGRGPGRGLGKEPSGIREAWLLPCSRDEGWDARLTRAALLLLRWGGSPESQGETKGGMEVAAGRLLGCGACGE